MTFNRCVWRSVKAVSIFYCVSRTILRVPTCVKISFASQPIVAKKSEKLARLHSESSAKLSGSLSDSITNIIGVKLFSNIPNEIALINKDIDQYFAEKNQHED